MRFYVAGPTDLSVKSANKAATAASAAAAAASSMSPAFPTVSGLGLPLGAAAGFVSGVAPSLSSGGGASLFRPPPGSLTPAEVTTMKSMIAGYRESAAFLYRMAEEIEQGLIAHENN